MMNCDVIRDLMPLYADGQASEATVRLVDDHAEHCPHCRRLLDRMLTPMEPRPAEEEADYMRAVRTQRRKIIRRSILACLLTALLCVVGWWLYMEVHFYGETPEIVSIDRQKILTEMPSLALTEEELALADRFRTLPAVENAIAAGELTQDIALADVEVEIRPILPKNADRISAYVIHSNPGVEYYIDDLRVILSYADTDNDGTVDYIQKVVGILEKDKRHCRVLYLLEYYPDTTRTYMEKQRLKHMWFSFLNMP